MTAGGGRALVVGAGLAGLLAARVLSERFDQVTVVEADDIELDSTYRRGVPQAHHPHGMLARGGQIFEELFPGLREELAAGGAPVFDIGQKFPVRFPAGWAPQRPVDVSMQCMTRVALEKAVRARVMAIPGVRLVSRVRVDGLTVDAATGGVTGVSGSYGGAGEAPDLSATLVVDASGRTSRLPHWLDEAGFGSPPSISVASPLMYQSALCEVSPGDHAEWMATFVPTFPPQVRRGVLATTVDDGHQFVCLIGQPDDLPRDDGALAEFIAGVDNHYLADALGDAVQAGDMHRFALRGSRWNQYHRMRDWPTGLIALGDSVCSLNPVYAQGMTTAAEQALALQELLGSCDDVARAARVFQRRVVPRLLRDPWLAATSSDLGWYPDRRGSAVARATRWYLDRVFRAVPHSAALYRRWCRVQNMLASPATLFHPAVLTAVLWNVARGQGQAPVR